MAAAGDDDEGLPPRGPEFWFPKTYKWNERTNSYTSKQKSRCGGYMKKKTKTLDLTKYPEPPADAEQLACEARYYKEKAEREARQAAEDKARTKKNRVERAIEAGAEMVRRQTRAKAIGVNHKGVSKRKKGPPGRSKLGIRKIAKPRRF